MGVIEEKIAELEARLAELEPVLREAADLKESIASLQSILARDVNVNPPYGQKGTRPYMSLSARKKQVAEVLAGDPEATNAQIAERLGITAARVGQIRQQM